MTEPTTAVVKGALTAISAPVTKLIECVSKGVGKLYEPMGIVREAEAKAKAGLILTLGQIEERQLLESAAQRLRYVECRRQANINSITEQAKAALPDSVEPEPVSEDWMVQFFENCKDIGEGDLQALWARLLAGEVAKPRTFSRRTMEVLKTFDADDAKVFTAYAEASFSQKNESRYFAFLTNSTYQHLERFNVPDVESHLISLGLLNAEKETLDLNEVELRLNYFGDEYVMPRDAFMFLRLLENKYNAGQIRRFTAVGNELVRVIPRVRVFGFAEQVQKDLSMHQITLLSSEEFAEWQRPRV